MKKAPFALGVLAACLLGTAAHAEVRMMVVAQNARVTSPQSDSMDAPFEPAFPPPAEPAPRSPRAPVPPVPQLTLANAYALALQNDANLAAARAQAEGRRERLPQARAQLLPNVSAQVQRYKNDLDTVSPPDFLGRTSSHREYFSSNKALVIRQQLFRPALIADYRQAQAQVEAAEADLDKETQNLSVRVTTAYLQALLAQDQLRLVGAQKIAFTTQLEAARRGLAAGSGTRTDIDEAQARLDLTTAQELEARQNVEYTRRSLQALIGTTFGTLATLDEARMPLIPPAPAVLQEWVARAESASPELRSANASYEAARQEVRKAQAGHMPTLDGIAQWSKQENDSVSNANTSYENKQIGFQLNVPLFAGGFVNSQVRQARAELERADNAREALRRDLGLRVEREFRGVTEGVLRVRALEQAVTSANTAAESARRSFTAGSRTQVDVLNADEKRVQALRDLAEARYVYLLSRVKLLSLTGEADQAAIDQVNTWLAP